jgi:hypothetical protein
LRAFGIVLIIATVLKLLAQSSSVPFHLSISASWLKFASLEYELFLGLWLLSGYAAAGAWLTTVLTFALFGIISVHNVVIGRASCGCFGEVPVTSVPALGFDIVALVLLGMTRPKPIDFWAPTYFLVNMAFALSVGTLAAGHFHGTTARAIAAIRDAALVIEPDVLDFGAIPAGTANSKSIRITNRRSQPVRIVGGTADCSCFAIADLPQVIPPGDSIELRIHYKMPREPGFAERFATIWTDEPSMRSLAIRLSARSVSEAAR